MRKLLAILLAVAMILCFTACGQKDDVAGVANPVTEYGSLAELNEAMFTNLTLPTGMEVSDESFSSINAEIAQYKFALNGLAFTFRCAPADFENDISGVYIDSEPAFTEPIEDSYQINSDSEVKVARWMNIDGQFSLSVDDQGAMSDEDFESIVNNFVEYSNPMLTGDRLAQYFADFGGSWQDQTSQRAMLDVTPNADSAEFLVSWGSSAFETTTWTMTVTLSEDGLLYYNNCTKTNHIWDENGEETVEVLYTDGEGYFSPGGEAGLLYWSGAADEECVTCAFGR